jgi:hypothetical protein
MSDFSASFDIPAHFKRAFSTQWEHVLQQTNNKFSAAGMVEGDWNAKDYIWQDMDTVAGRDVTGQRLGDTNPQEITGGNRRGSQKEFDIPVIRDRWDNKWLDKQALPDGEVVTAMKAAANRWLDDVFIEAAGATVFGGADPYVTPITFPAGQQVGAAFGPSGALQSTMTPWKILEATRRLEAADIDPTAEELYLAISPQQKYDLVRFVADAPNDMWAKVVGEWLTRDATGVPAKLMGYNVIMTNRLPTSTGTTDIRLCYAFTKRAFKVSPVTQELTIDRLPTKRNALQFFSHLAFGALRVRDRGVVQIACDEVI